MAADICVEDIQDRMGLRKRREYWSTEEELFPDSAFGHRFGMELHRFEDILMGLSFVEQGYDDGRC